MERLPDYLVDYFERLRYGIEVLFPSQRIQNKTLLLTVYEFISHESGLTTYDIKHTKTLIALGDLAQIPKIPNPKSLAEAEVYLRHACPQIPGKQIQYDLSWLYLLFCRHGHGEATPIEKRQWVKTWRIVQGFSALEQGFVSNYIDWLLENMFSSRSVYDCILGLKHFQIWMKESGVTSLKAVTHLELQTYLMNVYPHSKPISKKRILSNLKPLFHYYKSLDGSFSVPNFTIRSHQSLGISYSATQDEINQLWQAIEQNKLSLTVSLMLILIMGYGLPLKALPLIELNDKEKAILSYQEQKPTRLGRSERVFCIDLSSQWLASLWLRFLKTRQKQTNYPFLFTSTYAIKRGLPVSVDYCQRLVQDSVKEVLGYPIPVNMLERGAIKALAMVKPLNQFMQQTQHLSLTRQTRMMVWLHRKHLKDNSVMQQ